MEKLHGDAQKILRVTYLSVQKFKGALASAGPEAVKEKIGLLVEYLGKKEKECVEVEKQMKICEEKQKELEKREVDVELVKFLAERGFKRTAHTVQDYYSLPVLLDAQASAPGGVLGIDSQTLDEAGGLEKRQRMSIHREIIQLCKTASTKMSACDLVKKNAGLFPSRLLPLLVLPCDTKLFKSCLKECQDGVLEDLAAGSPEKSSCFYRRVALGVSGFITPACKESLDSMCPGCCQNTSKIAGGFPRSTRSRSQPLCSQLRTVISPSQATYVTRNGEIYSEGGLEDTSLCKVVKRCYFV
ncbi:uncharacterized protein NEMAJ01_1119 [Nematocida major]|uniref:uncharacterized protein n=1 Tax=Nematocida major TaxID=1912982 RepID=UPI0020089226|nr:uncharacterized protein NEMAJ01_1119 [Nematocida major]KAH9386223.1 hypothetical protein NEMAJ01_1119 [Nematocida major]